MPDETRYAVSPEGVIQGFTPPVNAWDVVTHEGWRYATDAEIKAHLAAQQAPAAEPSVTPVPRAQFLSEAAAVDLEVFTKDQLIDYATAKLGINLDRRQSKNHLIETIRHAAQAALSGDDAPDLS